MGFYSPDYLTKKLSNTESSNVPLFNVLFFFFSVFLFVTVIYEYIHYCFVAPESFFWKSKYRNGQFDLLCFTFCLISLCYLAVRVGLQFIYLFFIVLQIKIEKYPQLGFEHPFQYSIAIMALCSSGTDLGKKKLVYLNNIMNSIPQQLARVDDTTSDTLSMQVMALSCAKKSIKNTKSRKTKALKKKIKDAIDMASNELLKRQVNDSTFGNTEVSAALASQVSRVEGGVGGVRGGEGGSLPRPISDGICHDAGLYSLGLISSAAGIAGRFW